jgi:hypothetical protein
MMIVAYHRYLLTAAIFIPLCTATAVVVLIDGAAAVNGSYFSSVQSLDVELAFFELAAFYKNGDYCFPE